MHTKNAVIIFVRKPELGKVKSRLAKTVGKQKALKIYIELSKHTALTVKDFLESEDNTQVFIFYSGGIVLDDSWNNIAYKKQNQVGENLGQKMENAFQYCFEEGFENVCIIGSDCPEIDKSVLENAFSVLENHDAVIGPADDGGYYLLGMNQLHSQVFKEKPWGTAAVFQNTIEDFENLRLSYKALKTLSDIDIESDLLKFPQFWPKEYQPS